MAKKNLEMNPFVQSLEIRAVWKITELSHGGEEIEGAVKGSCNYILMDTDEKCSVYPAHLLPWFSQLPTSAKDMVLWIMLHLGRKTDVIEIREDKYCKEMGVSRATFYSAKTAITNRLIASRAESRTNTYWVNPAYLYKGDRVMAYRNNVREVNESPYKKLTREKNES